jgi:hypothetical protein
MTFLQPFILWGLPLLLLPVIIHLINRMRHRPQPWAAMMFLVAATKAATSHAKLRQYLVLLFRVLAVAALIFFLSRPLGGGWLGWAVNSAPDVIMVVLDRSASMETKIAGQTITRREQALKMVAEAAEKFSDTSHLVLLDSATREPQQLADASALLEPSLTGPTDTAADLPSLLKIARQWLVENQSGTAEIWIASDLQASNWGAEDDRWETLRAQFEEMLQPVRFRLLSFDTAAEPNRSVSLSRLGRDADKLTELRFGLDLATTHPTDETFPLKLRVGDNEFPNDLTMPSPRLRWQKNVSLAKETGTVWGQVDLPADANARDNSIYFVQRDSDVTTALVVSSQPKAMSFVRFAAMAQSSAEPAEVVSPTDFADHPLGSVSLLIWHAPLPADAARLESFVDDGGALVFFPSGRTNEISFRGNAWQAPEDAPEGTVHKVGNWNELDGPWSRTEEGLSLPVNLLEVSRRQIVGTSDTVLASYADNSPLLTRGRHGSGSYFFCTTSPEQNWSLLAEGGVLVPMLQRLLALGEQRIGQESMIACGELSPVDKAKRWQMIDFQSQSTSEEYRDARIHAGLYRSGDRVIAVNRPDAEDRVGSVTTEAVAALFGELPLQIAEQTGAQDNTLQGEVWRMFLFGMLAFLIAESWLVLPPPAKDLQDMNPMGGRG